MGAHFYVKKILGFTIASFLILASSGLRAQGRPWSYIADASKRFYVLPEFYNLAVLDRSTGLIWMREPSTSTTVWPNAEFTCNQTAIGTETDGRPGITGWRLPAAHELMTLFAKYKISCPPNTACGDTLYKLPAGHPFTVSTDSNFWTSTAYLTETNPVAMAFSSESGVSLWVTDAAFSVWCVRGES